MVMYMVLYWTVDCKFIFNTWYTKNDEVGKFLLGCFLTLLYAIFHKFLVLTGNLIMASNTKNKAKQINENYM